MEIWKVIDTIPYASVSNYGRIKTHARSIIYSDGRRYTYDEKIRKLSFDKNGYLLFIYNRPYSRKSCSAKVHRLVGQAFVDNPYNKPGINHKDGVKSNNHFTNLEWTTAAENNKHAYKNNLKTVYSDHRSRLNHEQVKNIRNKYRKGTTVKSLAKEYGYSYSGIKGIVNNERCYKFKVPTS